MSIQSLQPNILWRYFYALTQIPRPSFHEEAVRQYVLDEAQKLGLEADKDEAGNVLVRKPASAGCENAKGVILQAHLDMVAQKNNDTVHDFMKDAIVPRIDGEWVYATGTTLGADNGIGAAAILAILSDTSLQHGPLEALFTSTEETGMVGAKGLKGGWLTGDILLNLDAEEEAALYIGCAGGVDGNFSLTVEREPSTFNQAYQLTIKGLKGGHSGMDIIKQRGNANKILALVLDQLNQQQTITLASFNGGGLRNAIPREAKATFLTNADVKSIQKLITEAELAIKRSLSPDDREFEFVLETVEKPDSTLTQADTVKVLALLAALPNGVEAMDMEIENMVATSVNLAEVILTDSSLDIHALLRSADDDARDRLARRMAQVVSLAGGLSEFSDEYPGWQPNASALINKVMQETGYKQFGKKPTLTSIHAGLECGILATNYPNWEMISFGPTIEMPHSPDERVHIESVARFYNWLLNSLQYLAKTN